MRIGVIKGVWICRRGRWVAENALELPAKLLGGASHARGQTQGGFGSFVAGALVFLRRSLVLEVKTDEFSANALVQKGRDTDGSAQVTAQGGDGFAHMDLT